MLSKTLKYVFTVGGVLSLFLVPVRGESVKVVLIGDSTVTDAAGWGAAFALRFGDGAEIVNLAVGGRSSKSWLDEGRLPEALKVQPVYALIQFGHNDQPGKGPERETDPDTSYREYLRTYVEAFRAIGCQPILLSSVTRRRFNESGEIVSTLTPWAQGAKAVAEAVNVPFVDLHSASIRYHNRVGQEASMTFNPEEGDLTHFNEEGAAVMADIILEELAVVAPTLHAHLK